MVSIRRAFGDISNRSAALRQVGLQRHDFDLVYTLHHHAAMSHAGLAPLGCNTTGHHHFVPFFFVSSCFCRYQVTVGADDLTANYRVEQHVEVVEERERDGKLLRLLAQCHKTRSGRLANSKRGGCDQHPNLLPFTCCVGCC